MEESGNKPHLTLVERYYTPKYYRSKSTTC